MLQLCIIITHDRQYRAVVHKNGVVKSVENVHEYNKAMITVSVQETSGHKAARGPDLVKDIMRYLHTRGRKGWT